LSYLQSEERKNTIDDKKSKQDQQLINDINKTINGLMSKVGSSLNFSSIDDIKPFIQMLNNALTKSN